MDLPPGFRFHPTDEEIIIHYLVKKVLDRRFSARDIEEADLNKCEPWDLSLTKKEKMGEKQWFFCKKDRKYPTGMRINRATESGYWKATGKDKEIYNGKKCLVGMKKTLVFYKGRAPKGDKTNWVMHEYRLEGTFCSYSLPITAKEEWAVCRIFHKNSTGVLSRNHPGAEISRMDAFTEQHFLGSPTLPPLMDVSDKQSSSFTSESIKQNSSSAIPEPNPNSYNQIISIPISTFPRHASLDLPFQHQDRISSMLKPHATFPLREFDQTGLRIEAQNQGVLDPGRTTYKIEQFSTTNTMINVPHDTARLGLGIEMANKMTTVASKGETEREKPLDDFEGLSFSPIISDLDYLWSY